MTRTDRGRERHYALDRAALAAVQSYVAGLATPGRSGQASTPWTPRSAGPRASGVRPGTESAARRPHDAAHRPDRAAATGGTRSSRSATFRAPIEDVWAAVTEPERLARWIGTWPATRCRAA